jgi:anti-sigma regulatory factor (Ser/Thr protein kinase)
MAVPTARARTRVVLREWGLAAVTASAEVVVSELVTNAVQATQRSGVHTPVGLRLLGDAGWLVAEVWDCVQSPPELKPPDITREFGSGNDLDGHGNGLVVVAALSHQWGYFGRPDGGKVVFAIFTV